MKQSWFKVVRPISAVIATVLIVFALALNIAKALTPLLEYYHPQIETWASHLIGRPVEIEHIRATWYGYEPALKLNRIHVLAKHRQRFLTIEHITVGVDLWSSLLQHRWLPGRLKVDGLNLAVHQDKLSRLRIGHEASIDLVGHTPQPEVRSMFEWLLTQANVRVDHVNIQWYSRNGFVVPLHDIQLRVINSGDRHHIHGQAHLAQAMPSSFQFVVDLHSPHIYSDKFTANVYLQGRDVVIAQWLKYPLAAQALKGIDVKSGDAGFRFWGKWRNGKLQQAQSKLRLQHVSMSDAQFADQLMIRSLSLNGLWQRKDHGWRLSADHIRMNVNHRQWHDNQMLIAYQDGIESQPRWQFAAAYLRLSDVRYVLSRLQGLPQQWRQWLKGLQPTGDLHHTMLSLVARAGNGFKPKRFVTSFHHVAWQRYHKVPGVNRLDGHVDWQSDQGQLMLDSPGLNVAIGDWLYRNHLNLHQAELALHWQQRGKQWLFNLQQLRLDDGNVTVHMQPSQIIEDANKHWRLKLNAAFKMNDVSEFGHYLPKQGLPTAARLWLQQAFLAGRVQHGSIHFVGPLAAFPYDHQQGDFTIKMLPQKVSMRFSHDWPTINQINGELSFHDRGMLVDIPSARIAGNHLTHIRARINNLAHAQLLVGGDYDGQLSSAKQFLTHTPLDLAKQLKTVDLQGRYQGHLQLTIPLHNQPKVRFKGHVQLKGGTAALTNWGAGLSHINGRFDYTESSCRAHSVQARLLQQPVHLDVTTLYRRKQADTIQVSVGGELDSAKVAQQFSSPLADTIKGKTDFRAIVRLYPLAAHHATSLSVLSDLAGIQIDLPQPFAKSAAKPQQLYVHADIADKKPIDLRVRLGRVLRSQLRYVPAKQGYTFARGKVAIGHAASALPNVPGLAVSVDLPYIQWRAWRKLYQQWGAKQATDLAAWQPRLIDVRLTKLIAANMLWHNLHLRAQPIQKGWFAALRSEHVDGQLTIPTDWHAKPIHAEFRRFNVKPLSDQGSKDLQPSDFLPADVTINELRYKDRLLGHTHFILQPIAKGVKLKKLAIESPQLKVDVHGEWTRGDKGLMVHSAGSVRARDWGYLLREWKLTDVLSGGQGMLGFQLSWPGRLLSFKFAKATGRLNLALRDGRILKLSQETQSELGLGRFLNMLSLQSLPRRLVLNFGDLNQKGFGFDDAEGSFVLHDGKATTNNMQLNGDIADVDMRGQIAMAKKQYDLHMNIKPKVTGSLPFIATVTGGPLAGAITWLVDKLVVSRTIGRAAMVRYHVSGDWKNPKIVKVG